MLMLMLMLSIDVRKNDEINKRKMIRILLLVHLLDLCVCVGLLFGEFCFMKQKRGKKKTLKQQSLVLLLRREEQKKIEENLLKNKKSQSFSFTIPKRFYH